MSLFQLGRALARRLRAREGRTLVELLTGLAVAGIVGVGLSSILVQGLRLSSKFHLEDQRVYPVRNTLDMVVKDVRRARSIFDCGGATGIRVDTGGGSTEILTFTLDGAGRLIRTTYSSNTCTPADILSQQPIGYQIHSFSLTRVAGTNELTILIEAVSDNQSFGLTQTVTARMVGQP